MNTIATIETYLTRKPFVALCAYVVLVVAFTFVAWNSIAGMIELRSEVAESTDILNQLEGRSTARNRLTADNAEVRGSPFLEGATVTVAGASLLQRVTGAVAKVGGKTLSTQVELPGAAQSKAGFVSVTASCEVDQPALQKLLYDLEAGMPFMFVDQIVVQVPVMATSSPDGRLRVLLGVSSQWQGAK